MKLGLKIYTLLIVGIFILATMAINNGEKACNILNATSPNTKQPKASSNYALTDNTTIKMGTQSKLADITSFGTNVYTVGSYLSSTWKAVVNKFATSGTCTLNATFGNSTNDVVANALAVNSTGIYFVGSTTQGTITKALIVKLDSSGNLAWSTTWINASANWVVLKAVTLGNDGIHACGSLGSVSGHEDGIVMKIADNGSIAWVKTRSNSILYRYNGIIIDGTTLYVAGTLGSYYTLPHGVTVWCRNIIMDRYDVNGTFIAHASYGSNKEWKQGFDIVELDGYLYVAGSVSAEASLIKLQLNGTSVWEREWETPINESAYAICTRGSSIFIAGYSYINSTESQAMFTEFDEGGNTVGHQSWGNYGQQDEAHGIAVVGNEIIMVGFYSNPAYHGFITRYIVPPAASSNLAKQWWHASGGPGSNFNDVAVYNHVAYVTGSNENESDPDDWDIELLRYDSSGGVVNNITWGDDLGREVGNRIIPTSTMVYVGGTWADGGGNDPHVLICAFNPNLSLAWNRTWVMAQNVDFLGVNSMAVSGTDIYVCGFYRIAGTGSFNASAFLVKFYGNGTEAWNVTWNPGSGWDRFSSVIVENSMVYVAGSTDSAGAGKNDMVLASWDTNGNPVSLKIWGSAAAEYAADMVYNNQSFYVFGECSNASTDNDLFVAKFTLDFNEIWESTWGNVGYECASRIITEGSQLFACGYDYELTSNVRSIITSLDMNGKVSGSLYFNQTADDETYAIAIDGIALYAAGYTEIDPLNGQNFVAKFTLLLPPSITSPADVLYVRGTTGNTIIWTITDATTNAPWYTLYRNGSLIATSSWTSGVPVVVNIDGLATGSYNYTIFAFDGNGSSTRDGVIVKVVAINAISITHPADIQYVKETTGHAITWTATDNITNAPWYTLYRNGTLIANTTWTSGVAVVVNIDGLAPGSYNFTIFMHDGYGYTARDEVIVTVLASNPGNNPVDYTGAVIAIVVIGIVAGVMVGLYVLDKKKVINLHPFLKKSRDGLAKVYTKARDGISSLKGKRTGTNPGSTGSEEEAGSTDAS